MEHIAYYNVCPGVDPSLERLGDFPGDDSGYIPLMWRYVKAIQSRCASPEKIYTIQ